MTWNTEQEPQRQLFKTKQQTTAIRENEGGIYATQCPWTPALRGSTVRWCDSEELRPPHTLAASTNVAFMIDPAKNLSVGKFESTSCDQQCEKKHENPCGHRKHLDHARTQQDYDTVSTQDTEEHLRTSVDRLRFLTCTCILKLQNRQRGNTILDKPLQYLLRRTCGGAKPDTQHWQGQSRQH